METESGALAGVRQDGEGVGSPAEHVGISTAAPCLQHLEAATALSPTAQVSLSLHEECLAGGAGGQEGRGRTYLPARGPGPADAGGPQGLSDDRLPLARL